MAGNALVIFETEWGTGGVVNHPHGSVCSTFGALEATAVVICWWNDGGNSLTHCIATLAVVESLLNVGTIRLGKDDTSQELRWGQRRNLAEKPVCKCTEGFRLMRHQDLILDSESFQSRSLRREG